MLGKLSVALLIVASPVFAAAPQSEIKIDENGQAYKIKKVCQTVEVSGSFIPRTSCVSKKVFVKKPDAGTQEAAAGASGDSQTSGDNQPAKAPEEN